MTTKAKTVRTTRVMNTDWFPRLLEAASAARIQADTANDLLAKEMLRWLREQLPDGTVIDLQHKKGSSLPDYLHNVKVVSGTARGTRKFRIERVRYVEPNALHPGLSAWYADATPISMATGNDMSHVPGNSRHSGSFLGLRGSFGFETCDDDD